jgi:hypothetical protein
MRLRLSFRTVASQSTADAVLMELVNHPKFLGMNTNLPIPWPARRIGMRGSKSSLPLIGNFFFEPSAQYPRYTTDPSLKEHVDFTVSPDRSIAGTQRCVQSLLMSHPASFCVCSFVFLSRVACRCRTRSFGQRRSEQRLCPYHQRSPSPSYVRGASPRPTT